MKTKTFRTLLSSLLFVAILGFALWEVQMTREATANLGMALNRQSDLETEYRKTERLLMDASRRKADLSSRLATLQAAKKRVTSYEGDLRILAEVAKPWRDIVIRSDPKLQAIYLQSERIEIPQRYAAFVRSQGLSQEQAQKLDASEYAAAERSLDIKASAQAQGMDQSDPAVATLLNQSEEELRASLVNLLGEDGYSQLEDYQRTLPTREFVDAMAGELAFTDSPLNAQQANQLVEELSAANISYQKGGSADSPRFLGYSELMATQAQAQDPVAWDSIESQVQSLLNKTQFSLLNAKMQENSSTIQLFNMMVKSSDAPLLGFSYSGKLP
jgi:hypothetical protein